MARGTMYNRSTNSYVTKKAAPKWVPLVGITATAAAALTLVGFALTT